MFGAKKKRVLNLMENGARGVGTITGVRDTGTTINNNPRVRIDMRIEPLDGSAAFDGTKTATVSRVAIPQAGARHPVFYDPEDPSTFAYVAGVGDQSGQANIVQMFGDAFGPDASGVGMPAVAAPAAVDPLDRLAKLEQLRTGGVLSEDEFTAQKTKILAEM